uniref:Uncharacterized protein n=1 Tax=Tetranychus urticae TaxID=32264 RepID=T1JT38_TETUR
MLKVKLEHFSSSKLFSCKSVLDTKLVNKVKFNSD